MVKAVITENSIQWFSNDDSKEPFLEYYLDSDKLHVYDAEVYFIEKKILYDMFPALFFKLKKYWYPKDCPDSLKSIIDDIISNTHHDCKRTEYEYLDTISELSDMKVITNDNLIQWFDKYCEDPFLEYNINTYDLKINDLDQYKRKTKITLMWDNFDEQIFLKYWYPKDCPDSLKSIISIIIHARYEKFNKVIKYPTSATI